MADTLSREDVCSALGTDAWGLDRVVALGELAPDADGRFLAENISALAETRTARRAEAIADIATLDAPHLGLVP
ncbi:hypothetical protein NHF40_10005 [Maricaulaceae bacterium EIL42A08]|nr:hypothetical protein [Maricaulaceae bacterium EIL42A08]